jgi:hypothetical protein
VYNVVDRYGNDAAASDSALDFATATSHPVITTPFYNVVETCTE